MVGLSLILVAALSISFAFAADVYEVDSDPETVDPIVLYTEGYTPGMYSGLDDNQALYAITDYGSWSMNHITPFFIRGNSSSSTNGSFYLSPDDLTYSVVDYSGYYQLLATGTTFLDNVNVLTGSIVMGNSPYVDVSMSNFAYTQTESGADTLVISGSMRWRSEFTFLINSATGTDTFYANLYPVAVQFLVDGKPVGQVFDFEANLSGVTSDWLMNTTSGRVPFQVFEFSNVKIYDVSKPELLGVRIYYDFSGSSATIDMNPDDQTVNYITFNQGHVFTRYPTINYVKETPESDYSGDFSSLLSAIQSGLFNSNNVPFLDVVGSLLADTVDGISSLNTMLSDKLDYYFFESSGGYLDSYGNKNQLSNVDGYPLKTIIRVGLLGLGELSKTTQGLITDFNTSVSDLFSLSSGLVLGSDGIDSSVSSKMSISQILRSGFRGVGSLMRADSGYYLGSGGAKNHFPEDASDGYYSITDLVRVGLLGLRELSLDEQSLIQTFDSAFDTFSGYVRSSTFSWLPYDLTTGSLSSSSSTAIGQNAFMQNAYQSIEDKLGRLTYVFANDEEIELVGEAEPGLSSFKDSFGGGAKAKDIGKMKNTFDDVEGMFDTGFDVDDFFDSLNSDGSWSAWFSADTAYALDSVPALMTVGDEDPFNHQVYQDHLSEIEALRGREEADE